MNELLKTRLFSLLAEHSQDATNDEMQNAYEDFIKHVEAVSSGNDYTTIYRNLSITRIELASLELLNRYGQGGKCA
jgi:predicted GTPase